jgi:glucose repression regulatory protein TUP1
MVRIWDTKTGALLERFAGHTDSVYSVAFSPNGRALVSGALDQRVKIWDLSDATLDYLSQNNPAPMEPIVTDKCRHTFHGHKDFVLSVAFIGTNGAFGRVDSNGNPVATLASDKLAEVEWVVSGGKDWGVVFWDARKEGNPAAQFVLQGHSNSGMILFSL